MIYAEKKNPSKEIFLSILESSKDKLVTKLRNERPLPNPSQFEVLVCSVVTEVAEGTEFEGTIRQTGVSAFPDIVVNGYFGIEVKMTEKDHWRSTGNSILESLREADAQMIYILFGKVGGEPDVKYRLYQDCLPEVSVTHSPRYRIDMNLPQGESIFDKLGVSYDELRASDDIIKKIKLYYRSQLQEGEGLWWIDEESEAPSPVIRQFRTLDSIDRERFKVDCMIFFPELFKSRANYDRAAAYLITEFGAVSASLRDEFSAGGRQEVLVARERKNVSQVLSQLHSYASRIASRIAEIDKDLLEFYWKVPVVKEERIEQWKELVDSNAANGLGVELPSEVFQSGYEEANIQ